EQSDFYYDYLLNHIAWENFEAIYSGKRIIAKREVAWFGDEEFEIVYSGIKKNVQLWTSELLNLKKRCEEISGETYNSCLLNLYHDGSEGMAYHSDKIKDINRYKAIASLTFGAERKFLFKHKMTNEKIEIVLENGGLLVMKGETQDHWLHRIPPEMKIKTPRINLTFRTV
ncbi:alpha-ketoglutarate-dependent dioxygenase AlkB, partial [Chryseobacterium sp.]|uniref:alpha-ketoglutarate-dependent dioxygenase AlkB family protein n=1 Tax=Chryseobacterium sp. TaxID=1871047 RepID=UPI0025BDC31D